jgi:hypothetical protein
VAGRVRQSPGKSTTITETHERWTVDQGIGSIRFGSVLFCSVLFGLEVQRFSVGLKRTAQKRQTKL